MRQPHGQRTCCASLATFASYLLCAAVTLCAVGSLSAAEPVAPSNPQFQVLPDLVWEPVLTEPQIAQPVFFTFDPRGRMWVVNYRQYPSPAGLKLLSKDKYWRAQYDKVPPPPPKHFPGADRITIHEDTNGDGTYDAHKTFVKDLNIVTACAIAHDGVWVLNPPYLLFYPDRNHDDVPDGDPEVHLEGFGLEDTHSVVNSLRWGPDGWLYAAQGSTVTGQVRRPGLDKQGVFSMGQQIWRYHPPTKRYEIFAEGGGNAFGVEFDSNGQVFSGHNGGNTRGFHYVQGAYLQKGFDKHGPLSNPFAFGYFPAMGHPPAPRFTHTFVIYQGGALPAPFDGKLFSVAPLQSQILYSDVIPDGATFRTQDAGVAVQTTDTWFRPVDIKAGPDGAIYVADFHEPEISHLKHREGGVHTETGRIYRLRSKTARPARLVDFTKLKTLELVDLLQSSNQWERQTALQVLYGRQDAVVLWTLRNRLARETGPRALDLLWGCVACGGFDREWAMLAWQHPVPAVRLWAVRLLGDGEKSPAKYFPALAEASLQETSLPVRGQLAATAKRWPSTGALDLVFALAQQKEDAADARQPLLLWWALEAHCANHREAILKHFAKKELWKLPLVQQHLAPRLMRRWAQNGTQAELLACATLLTSAPDKVCANLLLQGLEEAFQGRALTGLPPELLAALQKQGGGSLRLRMRQQDTAAVQSALEQIADAKTPLVTRRDLVQVCAEVDLPASVPVLLKVLTESPIEDLQTAALAALQRYRDPNIAPAVITRYEKLSPDCQQLAQSLLTGRPEAARELLQAVAAGRIAAASISPAAVQRLTWHKDELIRAAVTKLFGSVQGAATAEIQQQLAHLTEVVQAGTGNPYAGRTLYRTQCAKCHTLFNDGGKIGPDLTTFPRGKVDNLLVQVVNPSAEIREGFESLTVIMDDGRVLTGFVAERDNRLLVLRGVDGQNVAVERARIEEEVPQRVSLMPENLLKSFTDEQVRDLFAYLRSTQPLNEK